MASNHHRSAMGCPSHFLLDRLAAGELDGTEQTALLGHMECCDTCRERQETRLATEALHAVDLSLLRRLEAEPAAASSRGGRFPSLSRRALAWGAGAAGAAAAMVLVFNPLVLGSGADPATRSKGTLHSELYVAEDGRVRVADEAPVIHPGATLQVTVSAPAPAYAAVVSIDGAGRRSVYVPHTGDAGGGMVEVPAGHDIQLPQSTILDDVLGHETVAVFVCRERLSDARVLLDLVEGGEAPRGCVVDRHTLEKRASR
jgi:hypothetical protein